MGRPVEEMQRQQQQASFLLKFQVPEPVQSLQLPMVETVQTVLARSSAIIARQMSVQSWTGNSVLPTFVDMLTHPSVMAVPPWEDANQCVNLGQEPGPDHPEMAQN